jgi:hypothetical protein
MRTTLLGAATIAVMGLAGVCCGEVHGQQQYPMSHYQPNYYNNPTQAYQFNRFYYYPYYYFPFDYWPATSPRWPEGPNQPYMRPPAYMAFPPFREPNWHYEAWQPQKYYMGFHFWLDQF